MVGTVGERRDRAAGKDRATGAQVNADQFFVNAAQKAQIK
jgi:hypothetical protein